MVLKDLLAKDYDYIEIYAVLPEDPSKRWKAKELFVGCCRSVDGNLIALDEDDYSVDMMVISYKEFTSEEIHAKNEENKQMWEIYHQEGPCPVIQNGLSVVIKDNKIAVE